MNQSRSKIIENMRIDLDHFCGSTASCNDCPFFNMESVDETRWFCHNNDDIWRVSEDIIIDSYAMLQEESLGDCYYKEPITPEFLNGVENVDYDTINHPYHYTNGGIECIDAMVSTFGKDAVADFCRCNAFKYLWRSPFKEPQQSIDKAIWYLNKYKELKGWQ